MNLLLIGSLASGKTTIVEKLIERELLLESNYHSIEKMRRQYSSGTHAGEMFAWAHFLERIEEPASQRLNVYEFSGTGRNVWNVGEAIKRTYEDNEKWLIAYVLADEETILRRAKEKVYDAPVPYTFDNLESSVKYMNKDLKQTLEKSQSWASAPKIIIRTDLHDVNTVTDKIYQAIEMLNKGEK